MAREKVTLTVDRTKLDEAKRLTEISTMSDVVDAALSRLIRAERLRHDIEAYGAMPLEADEIALGHLPVTFDLADDDIDYHALYGEPR